MSRSAQALLASPIFEALSNRDGQALAGACRTLEYLPGEVLFEEGDIGSSLFVVVEGRIALTRHGKGEKTLDIGLLGPRDVLGEMALLDSAPRSATATALSGVEVLEMRRASFEALFKSDGVSASKVIHALSMTLSRRLREVVERIEEELIQEVEDQAILAGKSASGHDTNPVLGSSKTIVHQGISQKDKSEARQGELWRVLWGVQG